MHQRFPLFLRKVITVLVVLTGCASHPRYTRSKRGVRPSYIPDKKNIPYSTRTESRRYTLIGMASYYGRDFQGKKTASGERFNMHDLTAAHRTLPFDTRVKVTNLSNNKSVVVRINDRGPHKKSRIIDLSKAAAEKIGLLKTGKAEVKLEVVK